MNELVVLWTLGIAGAGLFGAGGFFLGRLKALTRAAEGRAEGETASQARAPSAERSEAPPAGDDRRDDEVRRLREDLSRQVQKNHAREEQLRADLASARRSAEHEQREAESERAKSAELAGQLAVAVRDRDRFATEGRALKASLDALARDRETHARKATVEWTSRHAPPAAPGVVLDGPWPTTSEHLLRTLVQRISSVASVEAVAVTDPAGLVVAGAGDEIDELAAFGAFMADATTKAAHIRAFDAACEVSVRDRNGRSVTVHALEAARLSLVTLGVGDAWQPAIPTVIARAPLEHLAAED